MSDQKQQQPKPRGINLHRLEVQAFLSGATQLRMPITKLMGFKSFSELDRSNTPGYDFHFRCHERLWQDYRLADFLKLCPVQPGQIWFGREPFYIDLVPHDEGPLDPSAEFDDWRDAIYYRANGTCCEQIPECQCATEGKVRWRPSNQMPQWASRIVRKCVSVRAERLQSVTNSEAILCGYRSGDRCSESDDFHNAWEAIHGPESWQQNPLVWVIQSEAVK